MIGDGARRLAERALAAGAGISHVDEAMMERLVEIYGGCLLDTTLPYEGVHRMLKSLSGRIPMVTEDDGPLRTIGAAVGAANGTEDEIVIMNGAYRERLNLRGRRVRFTGRVRIGKPQ